MTLKITRLGAFSAFPIVLPKKKAAVQNGISHACARPQRDNQAFSTTEKTIHEPQLKPYGHIPLPFS